MARPRVSVVRGSTLGPWEAQNFQPLDRDWEVRLVSSRHLFAPMETIRLPRTRLPEVGELASRIPVGFLRWRMERRVRLDYDQHRLLGLKWALKGSRIVHTVDFHYAFSGQAASFCRAEDVPLVVTRWENVPFLTWRFSVRPPLERYHAVARTASAVVCTTRSALESLRREGTSVRGATVVYPGVDLQRFHPGPPDPAFLAELGLEPDAPVLRFVGRLTWEKGWLDLLEAARLLVEEIPRLRVLVVGSGPDEPVFEDARRRLGLQERVLRVRSVDYARVPDLHRIGTVFCLPSLPTAGWEEQFGMVLPEAMASGSAVVAAASGAIPEVVGDAGILVPPHDVPALARALGDLVRDPARAADLGAAGRERALQMFGCDRFAREMDQVYRSVT